MATSSFRTEQYTSAQFVESAGAVLFDRKNDNICLIHHHIKNEWYLPKGRRNIGESAQAAATREVTEETGYQCHLLPVNMLTRATPVQDSQDWADQAVEFQGITEPFMVTVRHVGSTDVKIITWFIAAVDDAQAVGPGEDKFRPEWFSLGEASSKLTFQLDRDVGDKAVEIYRATYPPTAS